MKKLCVLIFVCLNFALYSQCVDCYSIDQAMQNPAMVRELHLSNQGLDEMPKEIAEMTNLEYLDLSFNQILCLGSELDNLLFLTNLNLSHNQGLSLFCLDKGFFDNSRITNLQLENCGIVNLDSRLAKMQHLRSLNLANNNISFVPVSLALSKSVKDLNLSDNEILDLSNFLSASWSLESLDISDNDSLNYDKISEFLHYRNNLQTLKFSPPNVNKLMALAINNSGIKNLHFINTNLSVIHPMIKYNKNLENITFENCTMDKPENVYRNLKALDNLEEVSYIQTPVYSENNTLQATIINILESGNVEADALISKDLASIVLDQSTLQFIDLSSLKQKDKIQEKEISVSDEMYNNRLNPIVDVAVQKSSIDNNIENTVCFNNTKFDIPQNSFVNPDGSPYQGKVNIEVKEYFDPISNALSGMPMMAESNLGKELFASNGMFSFNAKDSENNDLKLNSEKEIIVELKDIQADVNSQVFQLDSNRNWQVIGVPVNNNSLDSVRRIILDSLNLISDRDFLNIKRMAPKYAFQISKKSKDPYEISLLQKTPKIKRSKINEIGNTISYFNKESHVKLMTKHKWFLDTLINETLKDSLKDMIKEQNRFIKYDYVSSSYNSLIDRISLTPDFTNDNYTMRFRYKGEIKEMPIYFKSKKHTIKELKKQSEFYKQYSKEVKHSDKLEAEVEMKIDSMAANIAAAQRAYLANVIAVQRTSIVQNAPNRLASGNTLRFGFRTTGIFNCDYFFRNVPQDIFALGASLFNKEKEEPLPIIDVKFILPSSNVSLSVPIDKIPYYADQKTIIILVYDSNHIGVIKNYERSKKDNTFVVHDLDIEEMSSEEVKKAINRI